MKCTGSGRGGVNMDLLSGDDGKERAICPVCKRSMKVRICDGGYDGRIRNSPKYFVIPTHNTPVK